MRKETFSPNLGNAYAAAYTEARTRTQAHDCRRFELDSNKTRGEAKRF